MQRARHILVGLRVEHAFDREAFIGIAKSAQTFGNIHLYAKVPHHTWEQAIRDVNADGLIISSDTPDVIRSLAGMKIPAVNVANYLEGQGLVPVIGNDDGAIGRVVAQHFLEAGFKHFAFYTDLRISYFNPRLDAFVGAIREAGFECAVGPPVTVYGEGVNTELLAGRWLASLPKPLGVMCPFDGYAVQAVHACQDVGLGTPDEVSIIGVDNDPIMCVTVSPPISSVATAAASIGQTALELLLAIIDGDKPPAAPILLPPKEIVFRRSTSEMAIEDADVASAVSYIRTHVRYRLTVDDLLKHVPVSRRTLERKFLQVLNRTPLQEIGRARVAHAKRLLIETDLSLPEVARRSGLIRHQRLANVLKADCGMTPGEFRGKYRRE